MRGLKKRVMLLQTIDERYLIYYQPLGAGIPATDP